MATHYSIVDNGHLITNDDKRMSLTVDPVPKKHPLNRPADDLPRIAGSPSSLLGLTQVCGPNDIIENDMGCPSQDDAWEKQVTD